MDRQPILDIQSIGVEKGRKNRFDIDLFWQYDAELTTLAATRAERLHPPTVRFDDCFDNGQKNPSKNVGAFDGLDRSTAENNAFGNDENDFLHFDSVLASFLSANQAEYAQYSDWDAAYVDAYATDLQALDKFGNSIQYRMNSYNPMYYLMPYYEGYQTSTVAKYWRINTGIKQGDTATTIEMNLAMALENYDGVEDVEFTTVWGQGHTKAERTGDSTDNFIAWVTEVTQK